jgi:uncharacterized protein YjiS (DUF1127 family)
MTHLPYLVASYGLFFALTCWMTVGAWRRMRQARRMLTAIDTRAVRP